MAKRLNSCQAYWSLFFKRLHFIISYRPGSKNMKTDALSCVFLCEETQGEPEMILPASCVVNVVTWEIEQDILKTTPWIPTDCPPDRTSVPSQLRKKLITWAHTTYIQVHKVYEYTSYCGKSSSGRNYHLCVLWFCLCTRQGATNLPYYTFAF